METLQLKIKLYFLAVDLLLTERSLEMMEPDQVKMLMDLNEWEETAILVNLLTPSQVDPIISLIPAEVWMRHRLAMLKRLYPYVALSIFQDAPAWWKDL